jgi:hypothetical protein
MPQLRLIALALLTFVLAPLHAQSPTTITDLTHWQVHAGDDPAFASPTLDDAQWLTITPGQPVPNPPGTTSLWYRTHLTLLPGSHDFSIYFASDNLSDPGDWAGCPEFFANGIAIGHIRGFPHCFGTPSDAHLFPIPSQAITSSDLVLAIHFVFPRPGPVVARGGLIPHGHLLFARSLLLENQRSLYFFRDYSSNAVRALLVCVVLLIVIAFALNLREAAEYRILIVFLIADLFSNLLVCAISLQSIQTRNLFYAVEIANIFAGIISLIAFAEFVRLILRVRRSFAILAYFIALIGYSVFETLVFFQPNSSHAADNLVQFGAYLVELPITALLPIPAVWLWRRRSNPDALLLTVPLLVRSVISLDNFWQQLNSTLFHRQSRLLPPIHYVGWFEVADITFLITLLLFITVRTVRIVRARAALASEVQAAQSVQQLLLNRSSLLTPCFRVESVYLPAAEVGGDFFLISPVPDGSLIAVIGDVSGKGLPAAMRVAMILGVLRRETAHSPSKILENLNQALVSQGSETQLGFTTACCLHITPAGDYTIANAAHISPYVNGHELPAPPALPLGLAPDQLYETMSGTLLPNQTLTLLTDGVPEARNANGTLYGFDRLPKLTQLPAAEIAQTAQTFGQDDDITVLTLSLG